ncbi:glucan endo-1,3-beta-glucosidase-like [Vicia villosa]|uniref:glucan endo-1,3-beta-glucosidase-like n=1 Tax=Vicia villosa TaxID=3911 RepID=UPI00273B4803|nr:glucan endo-1,3-beta-glucosidase-like [Vicia villosa]
MSIILVFIGVLLSSTAVEFTGAQSVGVCYGGNGNNLPANKQVVIDLYKSNGIGKIRLFNPDDGALQALKNSNIEVILGIPNNVLQSLTNAQAAADWVNKNVKPYYPSVKIKYIAVGNEIHANSPEASSVLPALQNIQNAITSSNLGQIKVSTAIDTTLIGKSYPPNDGAFSDGSVGYIRPIVNFLASNGLPLLANVYPYFAYANNQQNIGLDYALFTKQGNNEVGYQNLFDAILDSIYAALEKVGGSNVKIVVSESGWPSEGGPGASAGNAGTYYGNLIKHAKGGTPKRPNGPIETYLFAMFDENQKGGAETEKHFGLFRPDQSPKYQLSFN